MSELYRAIAGSPITYLSSDISAAQTTISIADDSALPDGPNICTIGYGENLETIKYETKSNGVLQNVTRGIEGTPRAWPAGTEVARFFTAYDYNALIENFNSHLADTVTDNVHGLQDRFKDAQIIKSNVGGNAGVAIDMDLENGFYLLLINRDNAIYYIGVWSNAGGISEIIPLEGNREISITGKRLLVDFKTRTRGYVLLKIS